MSYARMLVAGAAYLAWRAHRACEREGKLTPRQAKALEGHRLLALMAEVMHEAYMDEQTRRE